MTSPPQVVELKSVPGWVVFDLPGAQVSAGGTRLAPDVSMAEVALLARAMTYKFAALRQRVGGAKAGLRADPGDHAGRDAAMARYCAEIRPMADAGQFLTGPDMGTSEEDFATLRAHRAAPSAISAVVDGVPFEDARSYAEAAGWSPSRPWPGTSPTLPGWMWSGCWNCAASTATPASPATAARPARRPGCSPR